MTDRYAVIGNPVAHSRSPGIHTAFARATGEEVEYDRGQFEVVVNATSASLTGALPPIPKGIFSKEALAYDMVYARGDTPFLERTRAEGAGVLADGLGMLVEQAAESFFVWRGVRPDTEAVLAALRDSASVKRL